MSKPRKHLQNARGDALCGKTVLDRTTIVIDPLEASCPRCRGLHERNGYQFDEADNPDPEQPEGAKG